MVVKYAGIAPAAASAAARSPPPVPLSRLPSRRSSVAAQSFSERYPVQRHRWPLRAYFTSSRESPFDSSSSSPCSDTTMPGVQNPHCVPPCSTTASCAGVSPASRLHPSIVTTCLPWTSASGTRQEVTGW